MPLIYLPGLREDPLQPLTDRWVNPVAIEWVAEFLTGSVVRLRTGDTLKTALGVQDLLALIGEP